MLPLPFGNRSNSSTNRQMLMRGDFLQKPQDQAELFANF
jgi:hypothetical protein